MAHPVKELRSSFTGTAVLAILVGVAAWVFGVSWVQSVFLASAVMTVGAGRALPLQNVSWPDRRPRRPDGTRSEVARLSWRLTDRNGAVTPLAVRRLLSLAEHRLARHGVDLHDPGDAAAAERLLGSRAYRVVVGHPTGPIRYPAFVRCVAAIEQLDDLPASAATRPSVGEHSR